MSGTIEQFKKHNNRGHSVLVTEFEAWRDPVTGSEIFGPVIAYSWIVHREECRIDDPKSELLIQVLPDASGFICFRNSWSPDNCVLLVAYGKARLPLTVPWELTRTKNPESAKPPTSFENVSGPGSSGTDHEFTSGAEISRLLSTSGRRRTDSHRRQSTRPRRAGAVRWSRRSFVEGVMR